MGFVSRVAGRICWSTKDNSSKAVCELFTLKRQTFSLTLHRYSVFFYDRSLVPFSIFINAFMFFKFTTALNCLTRKDVSHGHLMLYLPTFYLMIKVFFFSNFCCSLYYSYAVAEAVR